MTTSQKEKGSDVRIQVREQYGKYAAQFEPQSSGCCGSGATVVDKVSEMYVAPEATSLPEEVTGLSLGCGDPVTLAALRPGQTVLDLGSGGGIDCFLAAQHVGETGRVIGVDMTAQMIEKARANKAKVGARNVEFRLGEIEHLPVADASVDVIISNCVINLSPDKPQVFREAFRVLKPGGFLAVTDIMTDGPLPAAVRESIDAWAGCVGGALEEKEYVAAIEAAGFVDVDVKRDYIDASIKEATLEELGYGDDCREGRSLAVVQVGSEAKVIELDGPIDASYQTRAFSGRVTARKPVT